MKFQSGDSIQVKENGFTGVIFSVHNLYRGPNNTFIGTNYTVLWDHWPNPGTYMASDVDDLWEKVAQIKDAHILSGPGSGYINQDPDLLPKGVISQRNCEGADIKYVPQEKKECDHKWVEVGFLHTKTVCYHCDVEKR